MARYIDADALLENLKKQYGEELGWQCTVNMSDIGMMIEDAPTADVAPMVDVDLYKKLNNELEDELASTYDKLENAKAEVAREIFKDIYEMLIPEESTDGLAYYFDAVELSELKKKYTDATDTNVGHKRKENNMYDNRIMEKVEIEPVGNVPPLSVMMDEVNCKAMEAEAMVDKINRHLFGDPENTARTNEPPRCFAEALEIQNRNLSSICAGLRFLMDRLGV